MRRQDTAICHIVRFDHSITNAKSWGHRRIKSLRQAEFQDALMRYRWSVHARYSCLIASTPSHNPNLLLSTERPQRCSECRDPSPARQNRLALSYAAGYGQIHVVPAHTSTTSFLNKVVSIIEYPIGIRFFLMHHSRNRLTHSTGPQCSGRNYPIEHL